VVPSEELTVAGAPSFGQSPVLFVDDVLPGPSETFGLIHPGLREVGLGYLQQEGFEGFSPGLLLIGPSSFVDDNRRHHQAAHDQNCAERNRG
jgi:hypothetical protein